MTQKTVTVTPTTTTLPVTITVPLPTVTGLDQNAHEEVSWTRNFQRLHGVLGAIKAAFGKIVGTATLPAFTGSVDISDADAVDTVALTGSQDCPKYGVMWVSGPVCNTRQVTPTAADSPLIYNAERPHYYGLTNLRIAAAAITHGTTGPAWNHGTHWVRLSAGVLGSLSRGDYLSTDIDAFTCLKNDLGCLCVEDTYTDGTNEYALVSFREVRGELIEFRYTTGGTFEAREIVVDSTLTATSSGGRIDITVT